MTDRTSNDDAQHPHDDRVGRDGDGGARQGGDGGSRPRGSGDHPAIERLRAELAAARRGIGHIATMSPSHRERVVASIRSELPDAASRAAYEAGGAATMAEIRRFDRVEPGRPAPSPAVARLWDAILTDVVEAVCAAR
jgi:hypothetical protein